MIDLSFAKGKRWVVMGLGKSGAVAARALAGAGGAVTAWDDNETGRAAVDGVAGVTVADPVEAGFDDVEALILSPGIPHTHPEPHPVAAAAKAAGVAVIGDVELLLRALPSGEAAPRLVGITGTNGKSTTTALIGHILAEAGIAAEVGGNLGRPALAFADPGPEGVIVLELSSYQLELTPSLAPDVAVWLNLTADHLARHGGLDGYIAAKRRIFAQLPPQGLAVVGCDDAPSRSVAEDLRRAGARLIEISGRRPVIGGIYGQSGLLVDGRSGRATELLDLLDAPCLPGPHNAQNAASATAACLGLGLGREAIVAGLRSFPGLAHRQERVTVSNGIAYINDSKATNADAAARALACYRPIYWIAGGQAKEGGLAGLEEYFDRIARCYLIGESAAAFARQIDNVCPTVICRTLESAVKQAHKDAQAKGDRDAVVLLSPAAASWDQFASFEARGDRFRELVLSLTDDTGGSSIGERRAS